MLNPSLFAFILYSFLLLGIGLAARKKQISEEDFVIGGRKVNFWVTALTAHASDMSSWLFMGLPMAVFIGGLSEAWIGIGLVIGMFLNWHFIAPRLRQVTEEYNANTLSSFFATRYKDTHGLLRNVSAAITVLFMIHYLAAGLIGMGFLFRSVLAIDYHVGICVAVAVVVTYTMIGGYTAVAWADTFQGIFLLAAILVVPWVAMETVGSLEFPAGTLSFLDGGTSLHSIINGIAWGLGYFGLPHILTKFMAINDVKEMYKSKWLGVSWQTLTLGASIAVGLVGIAFFKDGLSNPQLVFVDMVHALFHPFVAGFILCGILAATISTMDSQLLVVCGVLSEDLYRSLLRPKAKGAELLWVSRLSLLAATLCALAIAWNGSKSIMDTVMYSWTGLGASFGPLVLCALFDKASNLKGALAGLIVGGLTAALWPLSASIPAMIPAFTANLVTIILVSRVTAASDRRA